MRKLMLTVALAATIAPSIATADVATSLTETYNANVFWGDGPSQIWGSLQIDVTTTPAPAVDPGSLFPIVIDPNDPPTPPASATEVTRRLTGYLSGCVETEDQWGNPTYRCFGGSFDQQLDADEVTLDGVPLPGNAVTFATTVEISDPWGQPASVAIGGELYEPFDTATGLCATCVRANPWLHDGRAHLDLRSDQVLLSRSGYEGELQVTVPFVSSDPLPFDIGAWYLLRHALTADADA